MPNTAFSKSGMESVGHLLAAVTLAAATVIETGTGMDALGALDHITYVLLFFFICSVLSTVNRGRVSSALVIVFVALNCIYALSNVIYFRFFRSFLTTDAIGMWRALPAVKGSIVGLMHWHDPFVFVVLPFALALPAIRRPDALAWERRLIYIPALCAVALAAHWAQNERLTHGASQINPFVELARSEFRKSRMDALASETSNFLNNNFSAGGLYNYEENGEYPVQKVSTKVEPLFAWQRKPNIVLIVLESVRSYESGFFGVRQEGSLTPNLDAIAAKGMAFTGFYTTGSHTANSEFSILSSYLPTTNATPIYETYRDTNIDTLPGVLAANGYKTLWVSSYTADFFNKRGFWLDHGMQEIHDKLPDSYIKGPELGWGPADEDLFAYAADLFDAQEGPFFAEIMTLSNHHFFNYPYPTSKDTPLVKGDTDYVNYSRGIYYTDHALGEFLRAASTRPFFKNTIFVIVTDHSAYPDPRAESGTGAPAYAEISMRVPMIIYAPGIINPLLITAPASHIDIAPTILDIVGIEGGASFLGQSLFRTIPVNRPIYMANSQQVWSIRKNTSYCYNTLLFPRESRNEMMIFRSGNSHYCFTSDMDLFSINSPSALQPMARNDAHNLILTGQRISDLMDFTITNNRVSPTENR